MKNTFEDLAGDFTSEILSDEEDTTTGIVSEWCTIIANSR